MCISGLKFGVTFTLTQYLEKGHSHDRHFPLTVRTESADFQARFSFAAVVSTSPVRLTAVCPRLLSGSQQSVHVSCPAHSSLSTSPVRLTAVCPRLLSGSQQSVHVSCPAHSSLSTSPVWPTAVCPRLLSGSQQSVHVSCLAHSSLSTSPVRFTVVCPRHCRVVRD